MRTYNTDLTTFGDTRSFLSSTSNSWIHPTLLMQLLQVAWLRQNPIYLTVVVPLVIPK